jgi:spore maturation protein SpmA
MLNAIWASLLILGLLVAGLIGRLSGPGSVIDAAMQGAERAVMGIALPLVGMMAFWLGVLRLLEKSGVLHGLVSFLGPLLRRLFPQVPADHPALPAMVMNLSANMLGLGNSATPLGLKAMGHLQELNPHKQSASNAMVTFLALNTGAFTLIPVSAMNFLSAAGIPGSFRLIVPTILTTACASAGAVLISQWLGRKPRFAPLPDEAQTASPGNDPSAAAPGQSPISPRARRWLLLMALGFAAAAALELGPDHWRQSLLETTGLQQRLQPATALKTAANTLAPQTALPAQSPLLASLRSALDGASALAVPAILLLAVGLGWARGLRVYEEFVEGAREGFTVATRIIPFLVAMLAVLAILRQSGAFELIQWALGPLLHALGFPVELLSLALMRPLSGSGAQGILTDILSRPDFAPSIKWTAAMLYGSTETTFSVLTVYFGSVGIHRFRHALLVGLSADAIGAVGAVLMGRLLFT